MKKKLLTIICSFICFSSFSVTIDGISYLLEGDRASVKGANAKIVEIPDSIVVDSTSYKVYNIGDHAFFNDTVVEHIKLPQTIEKIWDHNFIGCKNLKTIYIQSNPELWNFEMTDYEEFNEWLYENCTLVINTNLKEKYLNSIFNKFSDKIYYNGDDDFWIYLGKNIQIKDFSYYIKDEKNVLVSSYSGKGNPTFVNEISLSNHNLNVIGIARSAFEGTSIDTLIIPDFIESIEENAFKDCLGLKLIECKGVNPPICNQSFGYGLNEAKIYANCELSVPSESFKLYRLMDCWEKFDTKAYDFEMEVIPSTDHATFTWTPTCGAANYQLSIFEGETKKDTICILTFDAYGRLSEMALLKSSSYVDGCSFVVRSLKGNKAYHYEMTVFDKKDNTITTRKGFFNTSQITETHEQINDSNKVYQMNGQIVIELSCDSNVMIYDLKGNVTYTSTKTQQEKVNVKDGIYIVKINDKYYKISVK